MSALLSVFIMWTVYYNGLCPFGLALGFTIAYAASIIINAIIKVHKEEEEKWLKLK